MPHYQIEFRKSAQKEFDKLPERIRRRMIDVLYFLQINPFSDVLDIKKLKGVDALYRVRVGDYRVLYEVANDCLIITVIRIGHRKDIYRD